MTPRLRFPEFHDAANWRDATLGQLGKLVSGLTYSPSDVRDEGMLVLRSSNIQHGKIALDDCVYVNPDIGGANRSQPNDILICVRNGSKSLIGKSAMIPEGMPLCTHGAFMTIFRAHAPDFVFQWMQSAAFQKQVAADLGATINSINGGQLLNYRLFIPEPDEQKRVADCLTSLDDCIAAQGRKVEALKAHKRGLMQQLFPREAETFPRVRFGEFRDAGLWEFVKAGKLFANRTEKGSSNLPIYSVTITDGLVRRSSLDRRIDDIVDAEGNKKVKRGDIAYNMMRMWQGACGVAPEDCMVSPAYVVLAPRGGVYSEFYAYLFKLQHVLQKLFSHSRGLTEDRLRLYYEDFSRILLPRPHPHEQRRIAECLSSLDAKIAAEADKLDAVTTHKKGLLQRLFPSLGSAEG